MLRNQLILHLRTLWRNRSHTFVNVVGLSLGITCSIIIFLILRLELSYNDYQPDGDRIYRVVTEYKGSGAPSYSAGMTYPLIPALASDFPDIEHALLVDGNMASPVIAVAKNDGTLEKFKEVNAVFVDSGFMKVFSFEWLEGNNKALQRERTVVLSKSLATKYFGNESALNKVINFNNIYDVTVTGVVEDAPLNSDLPFSMYLSNYVGSKLRGWEDWTASSASINCYVKLKPGVSREQFESKLKDWHLKYFTGNAAEDGKSRQYFLQPLSEMHFDTRFSNFSGRLVSRETLLTLGLIGIVLLLTACINFINLNTVLIIDRSKEAGVRKVMGSSRSQLVSQFLLETLTITLGALLISMGLVELSLMNLTPILGYRLEFHPFSDPWTFGFIMSLPVAVTCLAGLYPAIALSKFQPAKALKAGFITDNARGLTMRRGLIVLQLVISQVLVVCTIIVIQQINYFMSQPIGIDSHAVVEFELPENKTELLKVLKERLKVIPGVENVSLSNTGSTAENKWNGGFEATVDGRIIKEAASIKFADEDYLDTYGIKLLSGENLIKSDSGTRFIVTEEFTKLLGFKESHQAIGTPIDMWGTKALISGVLRDFHVGSLHESLQPTIIFCGSDRYYTGAVKLSTTDMTSTLAAIQKVWEQVYPKYVYEQRFLDETIMHFYDAERKTSYLIGMFAGVAIFIGCIGLFGLVSFMARRKTKEVGIRKTLGASVGQVVGLFSKEFVILILISFCIAVPITYYFMGHWLENFKYQIQPGPLTFMIGMLLTFVVVITTVGLKSYKAATANPVDALRNE